MVVTGKHYHFSTGKSSKNHGKFYRCQNRTTDPLYGCCIYPAYRDSEGRELITDTRHDLVLCGRLSNDDNMTLKQEKQALDSLHSGFKNNNDDNEMDDRNNNNDNEKEESEKEKYHRERE